MARTTYRPLSSEEQRVIAHKGTELPFSGTLTSHATLGTYVCARCREPLFSSDHKFDSRCGWPAFDDEILGAVRRDPDPDGVRTESTCARCGGHLGHVFHGEGLTDKNLRHCVNSISLDFVPAEPPTAERERTVFAGGCFWGVEHHLRRHPGVLATTVGYTGGWTKNPTYREVCAKGTGHIEAVEVVFDPRLTTFEDVARRFFEIHDPTQVEGQGPDIGEQYMSAVFTTHEAQRRTVLDLIRQLGDRGYSVATRIRPAETFWPAEDDHQRYYEKKGSLPYCHAPTKRF